MWVRTIKIVDEGKRDLYKRVPKVLLTDDRLSSESELRGFTYPVPHRQGTGWKKRTRPPDPVI